MAHPQARATEDATALEGRRSRRTELAAFLTLAFVIWPFIAVAVVGGYGLLVWLYQLVSGPPGPAG